MRSRLGILALSGLLALASAPAARAAPAGGPAAPWEAVGLLLVGDRGFCTGALVAADLVLTAAHCLFDPETVAPVPPEAIRFLAGWRDGRAAADLAARRIAVHPAYAYDGPSGAGDVAHDLALVGLAAPAAQPGVVPLATGPGPGEGARLGIVSYARGRVERPLLQPLCEILGRPRGFLVTSCATDFGASGAPVYEMRGGRPVIVSVVAARAEVLGRAVSLAVPVEGALALLHAGLLAGEPDGLAVARRLAVPPAVPPALPAAGGARFLRPQT